MRRFVTLVIPFCLVLSLLTACEISRPAGGPGDIEELDAAIGQAGATVQPDSGQQQTDGPIEPEVKPASQAPPADTVEPGRVLIKLNQQAANQALENEISGQSSGPVTGNQQFDSLLRQVGVTEIETLVGNVASATNQQTEIVSAQSGEVGKIYALSLPPDANTSAVAQQLANSPDVEFAEPSYIAGITADPVYMPQAFTPNDPYYQYQWHLRAIQMPTAWDISQGAGVTVAIIDTGVDFRAPDMSTVPHTQGYDFFNDDTDPTDDNGHGTHVAGTIASSTNNETGVAGVAFATRLMPLKALGDNGQGSYEQIIKAIIYAVDQGADVINLSLAGRNPSQALQNAVRYAHEQGVVVVAAAGNSGGPVEYPAAYDDYVIGVGSVRLDNTRPTYSNFGPEIDLVAPGGDANVDLDGDGYADGVLQQTFASNGQGYSYRFFEGTSMAAPHVSGVAALMLSIKPNAPPAEIEQTMLNSAQPLNIQNAGAGLLQAEAALRAIGGEPPPSPTVEQPTTAPTPITPSPTTVTGPTPTISPVPTIIIPTITPQRPVTPLPGNNLLVNSNFEGNEGWLFGDTPVRGNYTSDMALSGSRAAYLGQPQGQDRFSYTSVWQEVTIPAQANQAVLTANIYPTSQDSPGEDYQLILVLDDRFRVADILMRELRNTQTWEQVSFDISEFAGDSVYIYFGVFNGGGTSEPTAMYVDDVSLTWAQ